MTDKETSTINLVNNLIVDTNQNANKSEDCHVKCGQEIDMNDENEHLTVVDAISVQTELEQLFNEFSIYNHHIRVFKKLLNLKELKNQYNFFTFNHRRPVNQANTQTTGKLNEIICYTHSRPKNHLESIFNERLDELSSTLFKGGELSAMQVHSQLSKIKDQFLESQMLVTCLIHNVHSLRKHYCGTALDLVSSSELLANLEKDHSSLKRCKSIFKYQCSRKREQLEKLKQQLKRAHEDWNKLIVREPTKHQLSTEELLLLSKTQTKRKRKSIENQLTNTTVCPDDLGNQLNNELDKQLSKENSSEDNSLDSGNLSKSNGLNKSIVTKEVHGHKNGETSTASSGSNCDSAVHSESESIDSMQELAAAIYRRKSKLDRLEKECYTFMSRLANRHRTIDDNTTDEQNLAPLGGQFDESDPNLIIDDEGDLNDGNFNDYANEYEEDLLDEEYDDVEFDDETINDPFATVELDIENLLNRFSNVQTAIDTEDEELIIDQNLERDNTIFENSTANSVQNQMNNILDNLSFDNTFSNEQERLINDETHPYYADYVIGPSGSSIQSNTIDHLNVLNTNEIVNTNESDPQSSNDSSLNLSIINNEINRMSNLEQIEQATRSRLDLSRESLHSLVDQEANALNADLMSRISNEETVLAKTGEPISLCRLRRRAVKILASRIRTEKEYYEGKENELKQKLDELQSRNDELENQLTQSSQTHKQLFLISTAFVVCSLVNYFKQTI